MKVWSWPKRTTNSQNLVSTKSRNKAVGPSSRTGFKRRPDHNAGNRFDYFLPKLKTYLKTKIKVCKDGCISSKIQEWENITSDKETLKTVERLTLDFEQEPPRQKTKLMSV